MSQNFENLHWSHSFELEEYLVPSSLDEALDMLNCYKGEAKVIAGGTDVVPQLRNRECRVRTLVDISRLPEMNRIEEHGEKIVLGGLVTHAQAAGSALIQKKAPVLAQGSDSVGSPQIRQVATLAGNLVSGQPAADAAIALLALGASVSIVSQAGERMVPLTEFFIDLGRTALDSGREIITRLEFRGLGPNQGSCYQRLAKRKALTLPMLVCAMKVQIDPDNRTFEDVAIALGPVAPVPYRAKNTEDYLIGKPISRQVVSEAAAGAVAYCSPRESLLRGSCDYRREMVKVLVRRGLEKSLEQAGHPLHERNGHEQY